MKNKKEELSKAASIMGLKGGASKFKKYGREPFVEMADKRWGNKKKKSR